MTSYGAMTAASSRRKRRNREAPSLDAPEKYDDTSRLLDAALDESFSRDSIWHPLHPDYMRVFCAHGAKMAHVPVRALTGVKGAR